MNREKVLKYHFPNSISYNDITKTDFSIHRGTIDILTGGFPCQPYSTAGKRLGKADERHLFPEMLRAIKEIQPRWIIGENVRGLVSWNGGMVFHEVYDDLEREGYEVQSFIIPAASVNAPHRRDRIWFVAHTKCRGLEYRSQTTDLSKKEIKAFGKRCEFTDEFKADSSKLYERWRTDKKAEHIVCSGDDGISERLDSVTFSKWRKESVKAYGNAIVPQVALQIFKTIEKYETT